MENANYYYSTYNAERDTSDKLYFEPVTTEDVLQIYEKEKVASYRVLTKFTS